ncbi:hypothetical protein [Geomesophilobacter sediminis]|uniref:Uncharacterized protein n=1 Tax=Geomesophilobacter sediminis TaxID=2798584 RepID=A0A8J7JLV5_9BACT|nr:hypothetical protein [Geomesophilobacter sediminis]MBJ6725300.1 hypothetical protein [Geomesophilobacter sediminis]
MAQPEGEAKRKKKRSPVSKYLNLVFRVGHVAVGGVLFGGMFWGEPFSLMVRWHWFTVATGFLLIAAGIFSSRHWIYQGRGVLALFHLALAWVVHAFPAQVPAALMAIVVSGVVGSHLPGDIRHYSLVHRCRID